MTIDDSGWGQCPIPSYDYPSILLAHGGGGRLMHDLIEKIFVAAFHNPELESHHDGALIDPGKGRLVFTTDSYVVDPLFFPGGNIGTLAVYGTVNDLAMCGARPKYLSAGFILEEGLPMETLWRVAQSMRQAADAAGVCIVTGDTKVVDKGRGHGIFINTAGVGVADHDLYISPTSIKPGDTIILNGDVGRHGIAIMACREGLSFETEIESDCAPLAASVSQLIDGGIEVHCLRDLTRGGLATSLVEIAQSAGWELAIDEKAVLVREPVKAACEILGFDPFYVANEGRYVAFVPQPHADRAMELLQKQDSTLLPRVIGRVIEKDRGRVVLKTLLGSERLLTMLSGEQLPRIC